MRIFLKRIFFSLTQFLQQKRNGLLMKFQSRFFQVETDLQQRKSEVDALTLAELNKDVGLRTVEP